LLSLPQSGWSIRAGRGIDTANRSGLNELPESEDLADWSDFAAAGACGASAIFDDIGSPPLAPFTGEAHRAAELND
jgi:hypothetical protein